jgi:hypothetical protein
MLEIKKCLLLEAEQIQNIVSKSNMASRVSSRSLCLRRSPRIAFLLKIVTVSLDTIF